MLTNSTIQNFLKWLGGLVAGTYCYIALSTTAPDDNIVGGNVTEPSTELGYSRQVLHYITGGTNSVSAGPGYIDENGVLTNKDIIFFGEATGDWGTITHYCLFSSSTGGELMAYGELDEPITPTANTVPLIREGQIKITLSTVSTEE